MPDRKQGRNGTYLDLYPESDYDPTVHERPTLTVDLCIFRIHEAKLQLLLITRARDPFAGSFAFPGGYVEVEKGESSDEAAVRELAEETGIAKLRGNPRQFKTYANYARDPRWYTTDIAYYYMMDKDESALVKIQAGDDAASVQWIDVNKALKLKLAFDHNLILGELLEHLRFRIWDRGVLFQLAGRRMPRGKFVFTIPDAYAAYKAIRSDSKIDQSNFGKALRSRYTLSYFDSVRTGNAGRPAARYSAMDKPT